MSLLRPEQHFICLLAENLPVVAAAATTRQIPQEVAVLGAMRPNLNCQLYHQANPTSLEFIHG